MDRKTTAAIERLSEAIIELAGLYSQLQSDLAELVVSRPAGCPTCEALKAELEKAREQMARTDRPYRCGPP